MPLNNVSKNQKDRFKRAKLVITNNPNEEIFV